MLGLCLLGGNHEKSVRSWGKERGKGERDESNSRRKGWGLGFIGRGGKNKRAYWGRAAREKKGGEHRRRRLGETQKERPKKSQGVCHSPGGGEEKGGEKEAIIWCAGKGKTPSARKGKKKKGRKRHCPVGSLKGEKKEMPVRPILHFPNFRLKRWFC